MKPLKRINRLELISFIKEITNTINSKETFKNYIDFDNDKFQLQFLEEKVFGIKYRRIFFLSENTNTDIYHNSIKDFLRKYSHLNITFKTNNEFSLI